MKSQKYVILICIIAFGALDKNAYAVRQLPSSLKLGVATASYQVEGGWNAAGKGENIWDRFTHTTSFVKDGSTGDIACDSYNQHKRDVEMLKELGVDFYRFSLSWSRILPDGYSTRVNDDGIRYYNELINDIIAANVTPWVTIYHWDLPQPLQDIGGWLNPDMPKYFNDYATVLFEAFGDRVKTWLTFNEPWVACIEGYGGTGNAPGLGQSGVADYQCAHTILKAHAEVYHTYDRNYRQRQNGRIALTLNSDWHEPATDSDDDKDAADITLQFRLGWFAHPIFSQQGDYPQKMKDIIRENSLNQSYPESRLPEFTQDEINFIRGTADFFGLNHYTTQLVKKGWDKDSVKPRLGYWEDLGMNNYQDPSWPSSASEWLKVVPWGFRSLLNWIKNEYNVQEIVVFENGYSDLDGSNDVDRVNYYHLYLNALLDAIQDGVNVVGYTAWSLMDNFEWQQGYTQRFGIYYVDFNDPSRPRTPKSSALYFKDVIGTRTIEESRMTPTKYLK